ncbi:efflux RND transporter permease subunit [Candidatus Nitrosacidococcus tergens]|uniref:Cation efflux system protein CzcA n=1 Tax=Candidatus Nitrosacidococcus tergens TaxID=553981 RepID=A0A7G1Q9B4_9GAMM|nr:CusA/CzcA family heavy metal efflux RND transporter [Candidatus Nitrosacidococcus tergens]CAB1275309.1 Cation efflux system protein CzcA [Candidatus Nitrosacidococcus tergens]
MFDKLLNFSLQRRWLVILFVLGLIFTGVYSFQNLSISAVPDISNVQVIINTPAPGYSPSETEELVTFPVELAMLGTPRLQETRSISKYGLSQVVVIFEDGTDIYFARQQIIERIQAATANLPYGITPQIGPIATGLGEVFLWSLEAMPYARKPDGTPYTLTDLRTLQDWVIRPQLLTTPGLVEVNSMGGYKKEYHVTPDPQKLIAYGLSFQEIIAALSYNNNNVGAGYIEHKGEQYLIRVPGRVHTLDEIRHIQVGFSQGIPILVQDVAEVLLGKELRTGAATREGEEATIGIAIMLLGKNGHTVAHATNKRLMEINDTLPKGVTAQPFYNRTTLVDNAIATVEHNLIEGATLVIIVLTLLLGNIRAALIAAIVIPLSLLFTISGMVSGGISANLLSLGAIDFGVIVDGAVVIVENSIRHLTEEQARLKRPLTLDERLKAVYISSQESRRALLFGQMIIMVVYIPIFALSGVEGKMFHPMAQTVIIALLGAMILSVTFVPAALALFIGQWVSEKENLFMELAQKAYIPILNFSLKNRGLMVTIALVAVTLSGLLVTRIGSEFVPNLDEGDILIANFRMPGTSLSQSIAMEKDLEKALRIFPEIKTIASRIGTAEVATEVMGPERSDTYVILKPREEWPDPKRLKQDLVEAIEQELENLPGATLHEISQPIKDRFNEMLSGVKADVSVKVFGDDRQILLNSANQIANVLNIIPGATDVRVEQVTGLPVLNIKIKQQNLARYGLNIANIQGIIQAATGGMVAGQIYQGDRRFDLVVRLPEQYREDISHLSRLPIPLPIPNLTTSNSIQDSSRLSTHNISTIDPANAQHGGSYSSLNSHGISMVNYIPLSAVAKIDIHAGPNQITRENGKRRIVTTFNVRGRDMGSVVADAQKKIQEEVKIPAGYWVSWGGEFKLMIKAAQRLTIVIPIALLLVFFLLYSTFGNFKDGLLVFTGIPFALTGGILALWIRGINLSISAGVGFIALSGVAVLNGLVMVAFINKLYKEDGLSLEKAVYQGALTRLRPVLMTALVASLGFIPMALAVSVGAEVQRPLATVVIGGIVSSTILTLLLLPTFYTWAYTNRSSRNSITISNNDPTSSQIEPNNQSDKGIEK